VQPFLGIRIGKHGIHQRLSIKPGFMSLFVEEYYFLHTVLLSCSRNQYG